MKKLWAVRALWFFVSVTAAYLLISACQNEYFLACVAPKWMANNGAQKLAQVSLWYAPFL